MWPNDDSEPSTLSFQEGQKEGGGGGGGGTLLQGGGGEIAEVTPAVPRVLTTSDANWLPMISAFMS